MAAIDGIGANPMCQVLFMLALDRALILSYENPLISHTCCLCMDSTVSSLIFVTMLWWILHGKYYAPTLCEYFLMSNTTHLTSVMYRFRQLLLRKTAFRMFMRCFILVFIIRIYEFLLSLHLKYLLYLWSLFALLEICTLRKSTASLLCMI